MITIESTKVKNIIAATFPDYRKKKVIVSISESITLHDLNWSGGTRAEYRACTIDGRSLDNQYNMSAPAPWNNPFEGLSFKIPEGIIIAQAGFFCGKPSLLHLTVNPVNQKSIENV